MLNNNGYIVKELIINEDCVGFGCNIYRGVESFVNWPLDEELDLVSKHLTAECEKHFENNNCLEILCDLDLLERYVKHCEALGKEIVILKIMSKNGSTTAADFDLPETEFLGYDCMAGDSVSYLVELFVDESVGGVDEDIVMKTYTAFRDRLNANCLLSTYEEVEEFISERNKLLKCGINLEDYWKPVPVRLSLVSIK